VKKQHRQDVELVASVEQLPKSIRERAYELYGLRDSGDMGDRDDWLKAESQVSGNADRQ
jgi:DUF2934 family protein